MLKRQFGSALDDYAAAIDLDGEAAEAHNSRAWIQATAPDEQLRDGKRAVESATKACELTEWKRADMLDTLSAAYAEIGDFGKAVEWQAKAVELAPEPAKKEFETRLALYRSGQPFRDIPNDTRRN